MDLKIEIESGRIVRVLDYVTLKFPDNPVEHRINISIKDRNGDTECDAFGPTLEIAFKECMNMGFEIGKDEIPKRQGFYKFRRTAFSLRKNFREKGWALQESRYMIEREWDGKYSLAVRYFENDASQIVIYAKSVEQLYVDIQELGYEFVLRTSYDDKNKVREWKTLDTS